jgi:hypothetical protein
METQKERERKRDSRDWQMDEDMKGKTDKHM